MVNNIFKVLVVGRKGSGKTELIRQLSGRDNHIRDCHHYFTYAELAKLRVYFVECTEPCPETRAINYLDADVVLLCFDASCRTSFDFAREKFVSELKLYCHPATHIVCVGTKKDCLLPRSRRSVFRTVRQSVRLEEARELAKQVEAVDYIQTSIKYPQGTIKLEKTLEECIVKMTKG